MTYTPNAGQEYNLPIPAPGRRIEKDMTLQILLVHGTGVRRTAYEHSIEMASRLSLEAGIDATIVDCCWGELFGVEIDGATIPGIECTNGEVETRFLESEIVEWGWLFADPFSELERLTIPVEREPAVQIKIGVMPEWEAALDRVLESKPSTEFKILLHKEQLELLWHRAWTEILGRKDLLVAALSASEYELPVALRAVARAAIAQLHNSILEEREVGLQRQLRERLFDRLTIDLGGRVYGLSSALSKAARRSIGRHFEQNRQRVSKRIFQLVGDILLYQRHGDEIRRYISEKLETLPQKKLIVAHSLGGIAAIEVMLQRPLGMADQVVTIGTQVGLLQEMGALNRTSWDNNSSFRWLNIFDRSDYLSYLVKPMWPNAVDCEVSSGLPFPESHSAYFSNPDVWSRIKKFIES
jgi:hypothetical protein